MSAYQHLGHLLIISLKGLNRVSISVFGWWHFISIKATGDILGILPHFSYRKKEKKQQHGMSILRDLKRMRPHPPTG